MKFLVIISGVTIVTIGGIITFFLKEIFGDGITPETVPVRTIDLTSGKYPYILTASGAKFDVPSSVKAYYCPTSREADTWLENFYRDKTSDINQDFQKIYEDALSFVSTNLTDTEIFDSRTYNTIVASEMQKSANVLYSEYKNSPVILFFSIDTRPPLS